MPGTAAPSRRRTSVPAPAAHTRSTADTDVLATLDVAGTPIAASTATISAPRDRSLLLGWRAWLFVAALVCAYTLPGVLGHDPWKQDETYTFGIIQHMLETGDFVVPTNAGLPFMEKPPLYAWVATSLAWLLQRVMPLHDAARLASA
ncbi:ArnT family glycosyltransferase, partial [Burkholderia cenocepacia]